MKWQWNTIKPLPYQQNQRIRHQMSKTMCQCKSGHMISVGVVTGAMALYGMSKLIMVHTGNPGFPLLWSAAFAHIRALQKMSKDAHSIFRNSLYVRQEYNGQSLVFLHQATVEINYHREIGKPPFSVQACLLLL